MAFCFWASFSFKPGHQPHLDATFETPLFETSDFRAAFSGAFVMGGGVPMPTFETPLFETFALFPDFWAQLPTSDHKPDFWAAFSGAFVIGGLTPTVLILFPALLNSGALRRVGFIWLDLLRRLWLEALEALEAFRAPFLLFGNVATWICVASIACFVLSSMIGGRAGVPSGCLLAWLHLRGFSAAFSVGIKAAGTKAVFFKDTLFLLKGSCGAAIIPKASSE